MRKILRSGRGSRVLMAGGLCLLLAGCQRGLSPQSFLETYTRTAPTERVAGDYRVIATHLSSEYLAVRQWDSGWTEGRLRQAAAEFDSAHYFSLHFTLANPSGGPEDMGKNLLGKALQQGETAYRQRLSLLQTGLGAYIRLHCADGRKLAPISYRFQGARGQKGMNAFIFLFPKRDQGRLVSLEGASLVVQDFGIDTGTLKLPVHLVHNLSLKV